MTVRVWVNGERFDDKPSISALDHGITVGDGVFETCKVVDGKPFALDRHHDRLDRSLRGLGLPSADREVLAEGIESVLTEPLEFGRLRYSVTGGEGPLGSDRLESPLTYVVLAGPQPRPAASTKISVVPWTRNERSAVAGLKTTSYAENVVALARAKTVGASEAILANTRGELCEGTGSNVFVVRDGQILTPPVDSGLLPGITRALTLEACERAGVPAREATLAVEVFEHAEEVFITSSTRDIQPVHAVDDTPFPAPGPLTKAAMAAFAAYTGDA